VARRSDPERYAEPVTEETAKDLARSAENNRSFQFLARSGVAVIGVLHVVIGAIAISIATSSGGGEADQSGALRQLARTPGGVLLLWLVVVGMLALGVWQVVQLFLVPGKDQKRRWARRVVELGKAAVYFFIAGTAFTFARGDSASTAHMTRDFSATLLDLPGGALGMVVIGLVALSVGGTFVFRGASTNFTDDIRVPAGAFGNVTVALGVFGFIAKGIALAVIGVVFIVAAFTADPSMASGLDGAMKVLLTLPSGSLVLIMVGVGLIAYGVFFTVRARLVRL
jgi:hypothetical protein